ncbi:hypothetical protein TWF481_009437 [Arthrobotrys musiformis]|uniref:Uncharacterized protein n=1 Tax=Arthrobotrys musiformis TaxID=47236 RepID=A0AAV9W5P3_9PEZI
MQHSTFLKWRGYMMKGQDGWTYIMERTWMDVWMDGWVGGWMNMLMDVMKAEEGLREDLLFKWDKGLRDWEGARQDGCVMARTREGRMKMLKRRKLEKGERKGLLYGGLSQRWTRKIQSQRAKSIVAGDNLTLIDSLTAFRRACRECRYDVFVQMKIIENT